MLIIALSLHFWKLHSILSVALLPSQGHWAPTRSQKEALEYLDSRGLTEGREPRSLRLQEEVGVLNDSTVLKSPTLLLPSPINSLVCQTGLQWNYPFGLLLVPYLGLMNNCFCLLGKVNTFDAQTDTTEVKKGSLRPTVMGKEMWTKRSCTASLTQAASPRTEWKLCLPAVGATDYPSSRL